MDRKYRIKLNSITWTSGNYQSAYFERPCQIQDFRMNVGDLTISGFCGDHSKRLNNSHIGDSWSDPQEVTDSVVTTMLAYYYTHLLGEDYYNDECKAKGFDYQISGDAVLQYNGWIQEVVWLWSTDQIPSDYEGQVEMVAQAYRESYDARNGTHHDSIDDQIVASSPNTFKSVTEVILTNPGAWCECPVYEYFHGDSSVQPILVGFPEKVTRTTVPEDYAVTVKKVDATNPDLPLPGRGVPSGVRNGPGLHTPYRNHRRGRDLHLLQYRGGNLHGDGDGGPQRLHHRCGRP